MDEVKPDRPYSIKTILDSLPPALPKEVNGLPLSDRDVAIKTLSSLAEACLIRFELDEALKLFDDALQLSPLSAALYMRQGSALLSYGKGKGKEKTLLLACKKFRQATVLDKDLFSAWHLWGKALYLLGICFEEKHFLLSAKDKILIAEALSSSENAATQGELFFDIARVKYSLAQHSKEPIDWQESIGYFEKALEHSSSLSGAFWDEHGMACFDLFKVLGDIKLLVRAIQYFKASITKGSSTHHLGWKHLAQALSSLYDYTHDDEHFVQASDLYLAAEHIFPSDASLLIDAALMQVQSARRCYEEKKVLSAIDKCQRVFDTDPSNMHAQLLWAEALCLIGEKTDTLEPLLEGQNKIDLLGDTVDNDPMLLLCYGNCLSSLAKYYDDVDLFYLAIEKYQAALSMDRTLCSHWHAIGMSYIEISTRLHDSDSIEKAIKFFAKALNIDPRNSYYSYELAAALSRLGEYKASPQHLERAIEQFEWTLSLQKNAYYCHPDWLFSYAKTLDLFGDFHEEESHYVKALELLAHILIANPSYALAHHQMGLSFCHLAQLTNHMDHFYKALQHFKIAAKQAEDSDILLVDQAITLIHIGLLCHDRAEAEVHFADAEVKLIQAAKEGCLAAYYPLACLYSIQNKFPQSLFFLEKADTYNALPPLEEILEDDWLDGVKSSSEWKDFFLKIENKRNY